MKDLTDKEFALFGRILDFLMRIYTAEYNRRLFEKGGYFKCDSSK